MKQEEVYALIEHHYRHHRPAILKAAQNYLGGLANAEDVIQETYMRACQYWHAYDGREEFHTWWSGIYTNCIKRFFNEEALQGMSLGPRNQEEQEKQTDRITISEVVELIQDKPDRIKKILNLSLIRGLSAPEVAELVPETANSIRKIVHRFRKELPDENGNVRHRNQRAVAAG